MVAGVKRLERLARQGISGVGWYDTAKLEIETVAGWMDVCPIRFTEVLAITSPRVSVVRNIRNTFNYLKTGKTFSYTLRTTNIVLDHYERTGELSTTNRGQKVKAFARALLGDTSAIVLDVWMSYALKIDQLFFRRKLVREVCEQRVRQTANRLGLSYADTQACVWSGTLIDAKRSVASMSIVDEYRNWQAYSFDYPQQGTIACRI